MKTTDSMPLTPTVPSLFQIAAFFEDFFPSRPVQTAAPARQLPFAELMLNPEKLMRVLKSGRTESRATMMADEKQEAAAPAKRNNRGASTASKKQSDPGSGKSNGPGEPPKSPNPQTDTHRKVEFSLKSPSAASVKLAGDFTQWEKAAVQMMHSKDGVWLATVPLHPGVYSYRFIVDGAWCDDPGSKQHVPNPFGGKDAVIRVS